MVVVGQGGPDRIAKHATLDGGEAIRGHDNTDAFDGEDWMESADALDRTFTHERRDDTRGELIEQIGLEV
jgi:hypothetical protein